ncbi:hypothetical protein [Pseudalkalibacillus sp. SCS-8]|uniref:hypothetical protein n=1 Tax=Pseudalkalibacillus nanhaiensis TaxID=3115291 RepID=UPI0032DB1BD9
MESSSFAIALYQPKEGKKDELLKIIEDHTPLLRREGLITEFEPVLLKSENGTYLELFQWKSIAAKDAAHQSEQVMTLWEKMMEVADMKQLSSLSEADQLFPNFERLK